jgi:RNA polymerase sigma-70 factor (ECF subfamily)
VPDAAELVELVRAAQHGDGLAMAELIDLLAPAVARWCGPIALQDAPDAAQEALIAVFRGIRGLTEPAALFGWARSIAVREALRVARRAARQRAAELADLPARDDPMLAVDIADLLSRLSPQHRAVLMLREVEGLDERRVAELLDVPPGTVKSRLARARRSFRRGWVQ